MPVLGEIDRNSVNLDEARKRTKNHTSLALCSDDDYEEEEEEEEDYDTAIKARSFQNQSRLYFDDDDEDDDDYESPNEEIEKENRAYNDKRKVHPDSAGKSKKGDGKVSQQPKTAKRTPNPQPRKRRRSSARFLRLSGRFDDEEDGHDITGTEGLELVGGETAEEKEAKLGEMYRRAIRLNAENKINVGNSWGLNLIDNIDKFLCDENDDLDADMERITDGGQAESGEKGVKRVNFTKASCTLDASVKIYSYRVDDVHLTSYKVLANLNRTDGGKDKNQDLFNDGGVDIGEDEPSGRRSLANETRRTGKQTVVETIETNICKCRHFF